jgi:hypothetical protein
MKNYTVHIECKEFYLFDCEAESEEEAINTAKEVFAQGQITDYYDVEFKYDINNKEEI